MLHTRKILFQELRTSRILGKNWRIKSKIGGQSVVRNMSLSSENRNETINSAIKLSQNVSDITISNITIETAATKFCNQYSVLTRDQKFEFLRKFSVESDKESSSSFESDSGSLEPPHQKTFIKIGQLKGGVKFLVDLRKDLLDLLKQSDLEKSEHVALKTLNANLKNLLSNWFSVGFLNLEQVTWESPCSLVEKICDYEAVHPISSWTDIKKRIGNHRRCFVYTHPSMPGEPMVILHVALTDGSVSDSVDLLVRHNLDQNRNQPEQKDHCKGAIFYSVTSTQSGLQGIELGNQLIKHAVSRLQAEFPQMTTFSTLSPIPGFRTWLLMELNNVVETQSNILLDNEKKQLWEVLDDETNIEQQLSSIIKSNSWSSDARLTQVLKPVLMRLCARYLYVEKRRNFALNSVANFHIRNGACLWRLNWRADTSQRGMKNSCGIMVNYRYILDRLEENSNNYLGNHVIDIDNQVLDLLQNES